MKVTALSVTPVKGTRLQHVDSVELERRGALGDREFFVMDERGRMINAKQLGSLQTVVASLELGRLRLGFPDGREVSGAVQASIEVTARFFSREATGSLVDGPFSAALSEHLGRAVRLVRAPGSVDRGSGGAASLISRASLARLAEAAGRERIDPRRFRMLIEIDGVAANEEDGWVGRRMRVGEAVVRWGGHVGRCLITSRDPDTGVIDLPTLDLLESYRSEEQSTEPLPLGIYGAVLEPGLVTVGDAASHLD